MSATSFEQIKLFMRGLSSLISKATKTANSAEEAAKKASTSVAEKMNAIDPVGSGSFSMNRKSGTTVGVRSHAEGSGCTASGMLSHAEGDGCAATSVGAHAEGYQTVASSGYAHAEGSETKATAVNTHAEGNNTTASAREAHAEGMHTIASGEKAHSEGWFTEARAEASHAEGIGTIANGAHQHVQGRYNIEDGKHMTGKYAHIVGNGYEDEDYNYVRSNAHTLDWDGNAWFAGDVYVGGTKQEEGKKLLTENKVVSFDGTTLAENTVYTAELSGEVAFVLPSTDSGLLDDGRENRIRMLANVAADTTIDWGTTYYYGAAVPFVTEGMYEFLWEYNPLIGAWVAGATRIGQVVSE